MFTEKCTALQNLGFPAFGTSLVVCLFVASLVYLDCFYFVFFCESGCVCTTGQRCCVSGSANATSARNNDVLGGEGQMRVLFGFVFRASAILGPETSCASHTDPQMLCRGSICSLRGQQTNKQTDKQTNKTNKQTTKQANKQAGRQAGGRTWLMPIVTAKLL